MTTSWRCSAPDLPPPHRVDCDAHGDTDRDAQKHTDDTGHPTTTTPRKEEP